MTKERPAVPVAIAEQRPSVLRRLAGLPASHSILILIALIVVWDLLGRTGLINVRFIGSPAGTIEAGIAMISDGSLGENSLITFGSFLVGLALSIIVGVPLGLLMGWSRIVRRLTEPLMTVLYVTPYLALMPLIMLWVGIGVPLAITISMFAAIVPIIITVMAGVRGVDSIVVRAAVSLGANRLTLFRKVLLPASMPSVLTGIRLGIGRALLGVIVGEMYVATGGIGELVTRYGLQYRTDYVLFLFFLIGIAGYLISSVGRRLESIVERSRGL